MFQAKSEITFDRPVKVEWPDGSSGVLNAKFRTIPQEELDQLLAEPDAVLVNRVLVSPGPVGDDKGVAMSEENARAAVLSDTCAVAACAGEYLVATKGANFRRGKPGRGR